MLSVRRAAATGISSHRQPGVQEIKWGRESAIQRKPHLLHGGTGLDDGGRVVQIRNLQAQLGKARHWLCDKVGVDEIIEKGFDLQNKALSVDAFVDDNPPEDEYSFGIDEHGLELGHFDLKPGRERFSRNRRIGCGRHGIFVNWRWAHGRRGGRRRGFGGRSPPGPQTHCHRMVGALLCEARGRPGGRRSAPAGPLFLRCAGALRPK